MERKSLVTQFVVGSLFACGLAACSTPDQLSSAPRTLAAHQAEMLSIQLPMNNAPMEVAEAIMPPSGYLQFCMQTQDECPIDVRRDNFRETLTAERWAELVTVNYRTNKAVQYVTDAELYGRDELWTYPSARGDCEDYVLAKRRDLLARGWAPESLLIAVALDLQNLRHAVLIASTDRGDFVLDNQNDRVVAWEATGYTWEKRQSIANANVWVALTGKSQPLTPYIAPDVVPVLVADTNPAPTVEQPTAAGELESSVKAEIDAPNLMDAKDNLETANVNGAPKLVVSAKPVVSALKPTTLTAAGVPIPMPRGRVAA